MRRSRWHNGRSCRGSRKQSIFLYGAGGTIEEAVEAVGNRADSFTVGTKVELGTGVVEVVLQESVVAEQFESPRLGWFMSRRSLGLGARDFTFLINSSLGWNISLSRGDHRH